MSTSGPPHVLSTTSDGQTITAPERLLKVVACFEHRPVWTLSALSSATGLPKSTVHRLLTVLKRYGYVRQDNASGAYYLGYRVILLARQATDETLLVRVAHPILVELARLTQETAFLTVAHEFESVCLDKVEASQPVRLTLEVGKRSPLHLGASNRVLLAFLPPQRQRLVVERWLEDERERAHLMDELAAIRRVGYVYTASQLTPGAAALAVPVLDGTTGRAVAGLSIAGPEERFPLDRALELLPRLLEARDKVAAGLGIP